jgi:hypothetical protein
VHPISCLPAPAEWFGCAPANQIFSTQLGQVTQQLLIRPQIETIFLDAFLRRTAPHREKTAKWTKGVPGKGYLHQANSWRHRNIACSPHPRRKAILSKLRPNYRSARTTNSRLIFTAHTENTGPIWLSTHTYCAGLRFVRASMTGRLHSFSL